MPTADQRQEFGETAETEYDSAEQSLREKVKTLEAKLKAQEEKSKKDQEFYDQALQKRFEQMEAFEEKADGLELKNS